VDRQTGHLRGLVFAAPATQQQQPQLLQSCGVLLLMVCWTSGGLRSCQYHVNGVVLLLCKAFGEAVAQGAAAAAAAAAPAAAAAAAAAAAELVPHCWSDCSWLTQSVVHNTAPVCVSFAGMKHI